MVDKYALFTSLTAALGVLVFIALCIFWDGFGITAVVFVALLALLAWVVHVVYVTLTDRYLVDDLKDWLDD